MTTVEALKELFTALGGSAEDVENIVTNPEMVHAIAEIAGSAIELPVVSTTDEGDALIVNSEGKWSKQAIPSQLPSVTTTDEGDALIVDSEGKWAKSAIPSQLPAVSSTDNGNVLTVVEGAWVKAVAGAGLSKYTIQMSGGSFDNLNDNKTFGDIKQDFGAGKIPYIVDNYGQIYNLFAADSSYVFVNIKFMNNKMQATFLTFTGSDTVRKPTAIGANFSPST